MITYQDLGIGDAVAKIFSQTLHRLFLWQKEISLKKVAHIFITKEVQLSKDLFQNRQLSRINEYNLQMNGLFEIRES